MVVADVGWRTCGLSAEVAAAVTEDEKCFKALKAPIKRVAWAEVPAPTSYVLENLFYPTAETIVGAVYEILKGESIELETKYEEQKFNEKRFSGSF